MDKSKLLENKVKDAVEFIKKLKEENKSLKTENMKLFSELELLKNDLKSSAKLRSEYEQISARDRKIKEKIFDLRSRIDRLNI